MSTPSITIQCMNQACKVKFLVPADLTGRKVRRKECRQSFVATAMTNGEAIPTRPSAAPADPSLPSTIARFQVRSRLGSGAFGTVYRAYDPQLDREVAVKVPHPAVLENPKRSERFLREAKAAAGLRHPNIVPVYDSGPSFIASAFITGKPVEEVVGDHGMDSKRAAGIVRKIADGLAYAQCLEVKRE